MRKYIIPIILGSLLICSCQKDRSKLNSSSDIMNGILVGEASSLTKCEANDEEVLLSDMPHVTQTGDTIYISAFLSDMETTNPTVTKGAPITQDLLKSGYGDYNSAWVRAYPADGTSPYTSIGGGTSLSMSDVTISNSGSNWAFDNTYYWPSDGSDLYILSIAPYDAKERLTWSDSWDGTNKQYQFKYQAIENTPSGDRNAEEMPDMMVGIKKQNKNTDKGKVKIEYKHVCVGVRFEMGDIFGKIDYVQLKDFFKNCIVRIKEGNLATALYKSDLYTFTQEYGFDTHGHTEGDDFDNTENHDKTFMVVPQKVVNRKIGSTTYNDGELIVQLENTLHPETLSFKELSDPEKGGNAKLADWSSYAGKIITFRISSKKANNVSVAVSDIVVAQTKKNIVIKNDGKSPIFIRASIVGNWLNEDGEVIASWDESNPYGTFKSKNGFPNSLNNVNWKKGTDGFYYYRKYLLTDDVVSENLFDEYEVTGKPVDASGTWEQGETKMKITDMEMAILVQAVIAETNLESFKSAWSPNGEIDDDIVSWIGSSPERDE